MQIADAAERRLLEVVEEWNRAEKTIKMAEQVNGEIVNPAIYELRYGARRLIEALECCKSGDSDKAVELLKDAHFDCCRSRHDAIDAATSKITADLSVAVETIGPENVLDSFPEYSALFSELNKIRCLIAISRENREQRNKIYETIASDNLEVIVQMYGRFQASEPLMLAKVRKQKMGYSFMVITTIVSMLIGVVGVIVGILF